MKHMGIPRHFLGNNARKVPLNTILLPPLSPQSSTNVEIIGKLVRFFIVVLEFVFNYNEKI